MLSLSESTFPAGYKFTINLKHDEKANVNGVTFIIVDSTGKSTTKDVMLKSVTSSPS